MFDITLCQDASPLEAISQSNRANQSAGCAICGSSFGLRTGRNSRYILTWEDLFWPVEFFQDLSLLSLSTNVYLIFSYIISKKCMRSSLVFHLEDSKVAKRISSKVLSSRPVQLFRTFGFRSHGKKTDQPWYGEVFQRVSDTKAILSQWNPHYGWCYCFHLSLVWLVRSDGCITCNTMISNPSLSSVISDTSQLYVLYQLYQLYHQYHHMFFAKNHWLQHWTSKSDHQLSSAFAFSTARAARRTVSCWWRFDHRALLLSGSTRTGSVALTACGSSDLWRTGPQGLAVGITRGFPELRCNVLKPCKAGA